MNSGKANVGGQHETFPLQHRREETEEAMKEEADGKTEVSLSNSPSPGHDLYDRRHQQQSSSCSPSLEVGAPEATRNEERAENSHRGRLMADQNTSNSSSTHSNSQLETSERRYRPQKYCAVCGDKAIACNFNAVTCESCKAFFRRNAFKEQRLKCLFENRCVIDRVTRRFCSKCRLLKCFQIGMKREWILTDEQKQIKRVKILQNRQSKLQVNETNLPQQLQEMTESRLQQVTRANKAFITEDRDNSFESKGNNNGSSLKSKYPLAKQTRQSARQSTTQTRDSSTSCPDEHELSLGNSINSLVPNYCSWAYQCQFCSLRQQNLVNYHHQQQQQQQQHQQQLSHHQSHQLATMQAVRMSQYMQPPDATLSLSNPGNYPPVDPSKQAALHSANVVGQPAGACCCLSNHLQPQQRQQSAYLGAQVCEKPGQFSLELTAPALVQPQQTHTTQLHVLTTPDQAPEVAHVVASTTTSDHFGNNLTNVASAQATQAYGQIRAPDESPLLSQLEPSSSNEYASQLSNTPTDCSTVASKQQLQPEKLVTSQSESVASATSEDLSGATRDSGVTLDQTKVAVSSASQGDEVDPSDELEPSAKPALVVWNDVRFAEPAFTELQSRARMEQIGFTSLERELISEAMEATKFMFETPDRIMGRKLHRDSLNDIVQFCDAALRRLIKTVKQIKAFRVLDMDDQIVLLKTACFKILLLRSIFHYQDEYEGWMDSRTGRVMRIDLLQRAKKSLVYERHRDLVRKFPEPLRKDRLILAIMALVLLFDPHIRLKHSHSVELDNLIYLQVLRKYLLNTQPDPLTKYQCLVDALQVVNSCNEEYNVFFSKDFQPEQITPLLIEIFDISINTDTSINTKH